MAAPSLGPDKLTVLPLPRISASPRATQTAVSPFSGLDTTPDQAPAKLTLKFFPADLERLRRPRAGVEDLETVRACFLRQADDRVARFVHIFDGN